MVIGPPDRPPTGHLLAQIMQHYQLRALFCPPITLEQLVQEPEGLERVKQLDFLMFAGGPLSSTTGNILSKLTDISQFYGSTEMGAPPTLVPLREDWAYLEFHPSWGADMQPYGDDTYELVYHKNPKLQGVRGLSCNFSDVEHWHTKDLFRPHPIKPNLWRFHGRIDDIIVLSSGEKFNPAPSEAIIAGQHPLTGALIVGQGRFQAALLLEIEENTAPTDSLIEDMWPTVERANAQAPGPARISRSMIAVAEHGKRFERAAKGSIVRKMTEKIFAPEIEALYSEKARTDHGPVLAATDNIKAIYNYVRASINLTFAIPDLKDDGDLYVLGLDSLRSAEIVSTLKAGLGAPDTSWLSIQTIYAHPTVRTLSEAIFQRLNPHETMADEEGNSKSSRTTKMADLVHMYTQDLPSRSPKLTVALNGSTGSLGTYMLRSLLDDPTISKVYCLNRSSNAQERQSKSFAALSLSHDLNTPRVEFIQAHYGDPKLGLPNNPYEELTSTVDIIIHNAWKVDFNHTISSFVPVHIRGIRNLIDWNLSSSRNPRIIFISSISSVGAWNPARGPVPEEPLSDHDVAQALGYAESKHVSECILHVASERSGVPISILRVGQIGGPVTSAGSWNEHEWFPSMIQTSQSLGYLPNYIPDIDWIPVDILASTIRDIMHFTPATEEKAQVYNLVNPSSTPWASLINTVLSHLKTPPQVQLGELSKWIATLEHVTQDNIQELTGKLDAVLSHLKNPQQVQVVELSEWISMLEKVNHHDVQELTAKPAVKILDFFRSCEKARTAGQGTLKYSTSRGVAVSKTMRELKPVGEEWMGIWLDRLGY